MKVKSESEVAQSCPTSSDPMNCSLPGSSVHGIFQARVLEWGAIAFSARLPCPSPTPGVYPNSCPLSCWCHPTIASSVTPFSSGPQSFPALGSFPMSWLFASGGESIGDLASASVLPMSIQGWSPLGLAGLISLLSKGLSRVFSNTMITCLLYSPSWTLTICVLSCKFYFNRMFAFTNDCEWYFLICKQ